MCPKVKCNKDNLTHFGDQLAKTASKANTSVSQLGEAILTVGGTAKSLRGGTVELNAALGVLANRGVKGAEGGTALRNMILSLSAPTDRAAARLSALGVEVTDADGNMRGLNEIFKDLDKSLEGMTDTQKTNVLNDIFNKVDLAKAQAMLDGCGQEFDDLTASLESCDGAMEQMAATMNDTLEGDFKSLQSKAEAFGIAVYSGLNDPLKELVQLGTYYQTDALSGFTGAPADAPAAAFILEVSARNTNTRAEQMIKTYDSITGERIIYARVQTGASTWGAWCRYVDSTWEEYECFDAAGAGNYFDSTTSSVKVRVNRALKRCVADVSLTAIAEITTSTNAFKFGTLSNIPSNACDSESADHPLACVCVSGRGDVLGLELAKCVEKCMATHSSGRIWKRKGTGGADYYGVLRGAAAVGTPGILLEHCFHTNLRATNWLLNDENLRRLAEAEAETIAAYYGLNEKPAAPEQPAKPTDPQPSAPDSSFKVQVLCDTLNVRGGAGTQYPVRMTVRRNEVYTIIMTMKSSDGGTWGKLKSGAGWINIGGKYCKRI